ncbi:MAG: tRNA (5-methylaminomethyl-2-thiouridine)(34)-methyltransferase MnmD [Caulobacteraceae bacterium]|nr:tRNA (5-methylaminomethyl-2-thiouridine)(34)-methyltransferase MnmD [Caulobacteraceae bacterium]
MPATDPPAVWTEDGRLRSRLYDDIYFAEDGLAESRAVFLEGCDLPRAWRDRRRFVVAELGFGTGLNIAALLDLWLRDRPADGRLHVFSVEAHPLPSADAAAALRRWPEIGAAAGLLIERWPGRARGFHRIDLAEHGVLIDLAVLEVAEALAGWSGRADAWFLDGFAPSANPDMWRPKVLELVAARSAPDARLATFSAAGAVRRGLQAAGFEVERRPGHGRKRHRLEARRTGQASVESPPATVAVVGGGIAGAALARAFAGLGANAVVHERARLGAGASGNDAALVSPRLDAGLGPEAQLFAQAFRHATGAYGQVPGGVLARGLLQLERTDRDAGRFARIAASDLFEAGTLTPRTSDEVAERLGEAAGAGLELAEALTIVPAKVLAAWTPEVEIAQVAGLERDSDGWRLLDAGGGQIARADIVCLAAGHGLAGLAALPLSPIRGQAETVEGDIAVPAAFGAYAIPTGDGVLFGATFDRGEAEVVVTPQAEARNRAALAARLPGLAGRLAGPSRSRAAIRAVAPDRRPVAGRLDEGLFALGGLGSRGFTLAPLLAEHVAALALGAPSPLPSPLGTLVSPERFRQMRSIGRSRP